MTEVLIIAKWQQDLQIHSSVIHYTNLENAEASIGVGGVNSRNIAHHIECGWKAHKPIINRQQKVPYTSIPAGALVFTLTR
jgi:hypothetical protein